MASRRPRARQVAAALPILVAATSLGPFALGAEGSSEVPAVTATAAADGARFVRYAPGGPVSDRLIDSGGPSAQVAVSTLGTSTAYAALPDPGSTANSAPGLVVGLLGQGAYGLPPISLPVKPPPLPLQVSTDATGTKDASFGSGPYTISAHSERLGGDARGSAGLVLGAAPAAGLRSHASVKVNADRSVTATATSETSGLSIGSLRLGTVVSEATMTLASNGTLTRRATTTILGATLSGTGVNITNGYLEITGTGQKIPLNELSSRVLPSGYALSFEQTKTTPNAAVAPAVVLTAPFTDPLGSGSYTVTLGGSSASMQGAAAPSPGTFVPPPTASMPTGATGSVPPAVAPVASGAAETPPMPDTLVSTASPRPPSFIRPVASVRIASRDPFDIKTLYLALTVLCLSLLGTGFVIRLVGAHS